MELPLPEPLLVDLPSNNTEKLVVNLNSDEARSLALSGGKGNSLALLTSMDQKDAVCSSLGSFL